MTKTLQAAKLHEIAAVVDAPARHEVDRTFGLPTRLYGATVGLYLGFLSVLGVSFMNSTLAIPMVIFIGIIAAGFGVPMLWARMRSDHDSRALSWSRFASEGIDTLTGRLTAGEATAQVLILPILIFAWAVTIAIIAATV